MNAIQMKRMSILNMMPKCACGRPTSEVDMVEEVARCSSCAMAHDYEKASKARKPYLFN